MTAFCSASLSLVKSLHFIVSQPAGAGTSGTSVLPGIGKPGICGRPGMFGNPGIPGTRAQLTVCASTAN